MRPHCLFTDRLEPNAHAVDVQPLVIAPAIPAFFWPLGPERASVASGPRWGALPRPARHKLPLLRQGSRARAVSLDSAYRSDRKRLGARCPHGSRLQLGKLRLRADAGSLPLTARSLGLGMPGHEALRLADAATAAEATR
jgi:hypothetical protein